MSTKVIVLYGLSDAQTVWRWIQSGVSQPSSAELPCIQGNIQRKPKLLASH